jgi:GNAT superfamily N-acetyltransferase
MLEAGLLWVADDGEVIAFLAARRVSRRMHIYELDVSHGAQRRGIGRRMVEFAIARAREAGLDGLSLTTFRGVPWNAPFYRSCGFEDWTEGRPADLDAILADEAAKGLRDRCAMRLTLWRSRP